MSPRKLLLHVKRIPADSEFIRAVDPDTAELARYSPEYYAVLDLFDLFARANFQNPKPYPRPQDLIKRRERQRWLDEALEAQRLRNLARDAAEGGDT